MNKNKEEEIAELLESSVFDNQGYFANYWMVDAEKFKQAIKKLRSEPEPDEKEAIDNAINALTKHRHEAMITCEENCLCWELATLINIFANTEPEASTEPEQDDKPVCQAEQDETYECPNCGRFYSEEMPCPYHCGVMTIKADAKSKIERLEKQLAEAKEENKKLHNAIGACIGIIRASAQVNTKRLANMLEQALKGAELDEYEEKKE